jgi:hypothetical protein
MKTIYIRQTYILLLLLLFIRRFQDQSTTYNLHIVHLITRPRKSAPLWLDKIDASSGESPGTLNDLWGYVKAGKKALNAISISLLKLQLLPSSASGGCVCSMFRHRVRLFLGVYVPLRRFATFSHPAETALLISTQSAQSCCGWSSV